MTTSGVGSNSKTNNKSSTTGASKYGLKPEDFIKLMVTQLQQQDPTKPASNEELLSQMSQIGQLQSSTDLQTALKGMVQQNSIGSASTLIGKHVDGLDANGDPLSGTVSSVKVTTDAVSLQLDNGSTMSLNNVTSISPVTGTH